MKNLLENIKVITEILKSENIEIKDYPDMNHYFIDSKVTVWGKDYYISVGFWDEFDCRIERIENNIKVDFIGFEHTQDLADTLEKALDEIIAYKG